MASTSTSAAAPAASPTFLSFQITSQNNAKPLSPRTGQLVASGSATVKTPAIVAYTKKGAPVHLTPDNVGRLPIEMVQIAYEHFLDYTPPTFLDAPYSLAKYIGLRQTTGPTSNGRASAPILFTTLRDPSDIRDIVGNTDLYIASRSFRGVQKVTPKLFSSIALSKPPQVVLALADEPLGYTSSSKRIPKSILRSERWLLDLLQTATQAETDTSIFACMVGGTNLAARREYGMSVASIAQLHPERLAGVSINLNSLRSPDVMQGMHIDGPDPADLVAASIGPLPHTLPRLVQCPQGPHEILALVSQGIDIFMDEWSSTLSSYGIALDFIFPAPSGPTESQAAEVGFNLFEDQYATDFNPLASSSLHLRLLDSYGSEALGDCPTRAYVHHLLHTHEMTSHLLLAMHNTCVMDLFMAGIRKCISNGTFEREKERFGLAYSNELACLRDAKVQAGKINQERGKGRLKGLGKERIDGTPDAEVEATSFTDVKVAAKDSL